VDRLDRRCKEDVVKRTQITVLFCVLLTQSWVSGQSTDPFVGTWQINLAKSSFGTPEAAYKKSVIRIEPAKQGQQRMRVETVAANGQLMQYEFSAGYDGKPYPLKGRGMIPQDTVTLKRLDERTFERVFRRGERITITAVNRVSADGKTLTLTQNGIGVGGKPLKLTLIYEKQ
jgi:hypothetical protein